MTKKIVVFVLSILFGFVMSMLLSCSTFSTHVASDVKEQTILIKYKPGVKAPFVSGVRSVGSINQIGVSIIKIPSTRGIDTLQQLRNSGAVEWAEYDPVASPDFTPNDTYYSKQWHLKKIACPSAWDSTTGDTSVIIAILDTGVNSLHPDLAANIVSGWNTYDNNADTSDVYGHGTTVAGCAVASTNNGIGIAGVAPDCKIMPMRITDKAGLGYGSTIAEGLTWAADHGARVANVSFRMDYSATVTAAAQYFMSKGGVVTMSAGNDSKNYPNATDNTAIITVGGTTKSNTLATWSNTGANVDLVAPGTSIYTTKRDGTYGSMSGTSYSAPIVAGVAGLVVSACPTCTGERITEILKSSADDVGVGYGRVNAEKAVALANGTLSIDTSSTVTPVTITDTTSDTTPPVVAIVSPSNGDTVSGSVNVMVGVTDNIAVKKVQLMVDGVYVTQNLKAPYTNVWDASTATSGTHTIYVRALDYSGNLGKSQTITVTK